MKRSLLITGTLVALLVVGLAAQESDAVVRAEDDEDLALAVWDQQAIPQDRPFYRYNWIRTELGLTDEQIATLEQMRLQHQKRSIELGAKARMLQLELNDLMRNWADDAAVQAKATELAELRSDMAHMQINNRLEQRSIFTPEQRAKLQAFEKAFPMGRGMGRGITPGRGYGRGFGTDPGFRSGAGRGFRPGMGRGFQPGMGRGYAPRYYGGYCRFR